MANHEQEIKPPAEYPNIFAVLSDLVEAQREYDRFSFTDDGNLREGLDREEADRLIDETDRLAKLATVTGATDFDIYLAWLEGVNPKRRQGVFELICEGATLPFSELAVLQNRYGLEQPSL